MISKQLHEKIETIAAQYPNRESALMPALDEAQRSNDNYLSGADIAETASILNVSRSRAMGVATYYTMFNTKKKGKFHIQVDANVPGMLMGADEILQHLKDSLHIDTGQTTKDGLFTLSKVEDLGSCGTCPVIQVNDVYFENMTVKKTDALIQSLRQGKIPSPETTYNFGSECGILLKNRGVKNARSIEVYKKNGGYDGLKKALTLTPPEILEQVKFAVVRGRGGAGFPLGMKWGFLPKNDSRPVYLICNADEGEPGTFKDRQIMEYDPHLLIEGMLISARAVGAQKAFIYIRGEFRWISHILEQAIEEARKEGLLNTVDIVVHRGAGSYVCGEETALIESLEGKRGNPRLKPPFPANKGLYKCPTIVNNVETFACLPYVFTHGVESYKKIGAVGNLGPKIFGVSGHVNKPGVYEFPLGVPLATILKAAGGVKGKLKGVIVGGLSVPILTPEEAKDLKMEYDACLKAGTMMGSGGVIVINDTVSIPKLALRTISFYAHESCGQCTPCREGSHYIKFLISNLIKGIGKKEDIDTILRFCDTIMGLTLCPTGDAFAMPIRAMVNKYRAEFEGLVKE